MILKFPVVELVDRYCIACVKRQRQVQNNLEYEFYRTQIENLDITKVTNDIQQLMEIHNQIWELEKELKSGTEQHLDLAEIGRRAIDIRDLNRERIKIKNVIADKLSIDDVREIKHDHLSA